MSRIKKILLAGESWVIQTTHVKGLDSFTQWGYGTGDKWVREALEKAGYQVRHMPNHEAIEHFPASVDALREYDCVILSDIGSNTLLLHPDTTNKSLRTPHRLEIIRQYVEEGGSLIMIGGYMSFQGIDAKAQYAGSAVEQALPVEMLKVDDRVEMPQGFVPIVKKPEHEIMKGLPAEWPFLLSYNRIIAKPEAEVILEYNGDPILAVWNYGKGRSAAIAVDAAPHGAPTEFLEWTYFPIYWKQLAQWLMKDR